MGMANDKLTTYKAKRDFRQTREPSGHLEPRMPELIVLALALPKASRVSSIRHKFAARIRVHEQPSDGSQLRPLPVARR